MKKAFTLIELMIVIIVIAVLAVVAIVQYNVSIERARSSEAKDVLGHMRKMCAAIYARDKNVINCTPQSMNIGTDAEMIPSSCCRTHYFNYSAEESPSFENVMVFTADRCMQYGRPPDAKQPGRITLTVDYENSTDTFKSIGVY